LDSICLYFFHFSEQYLRGSFALDDDQIAHLAVYKLISDLGSASKEDYELKGIITNLTYPKDYIPE
jgi:hypothetical protein